MGARLLETPPVYCSACWCANTEKRHVDFNADNDQGYGNATDTQIAFDNLQICEDCMKAGAQLVGMVDASETERELASLKVERDRLSRELRQARTFADNLESAFEHRPEHGPIRIDHRKKPRQIQPQEAVANG